jgi:probable H4MPT-linked C1 transfer pathway protein
MAEAAWTGLDVGGAHLKVAQVDRDERVTAALQVPCALWQGLDRLDAALATALRDVAPTGAVAVTMTGELVDLFPDRATGVRHLVDHLLPLGGSSGLLRFWAGRDGFVDSATASARPLDVASANWLATATLAARRVPDTLLIDIGSTTSDVLVLAGGEVRARGWSDRERLVAEELVYTGATRTPLMALAREVPFLGERVPLTAEYFATTADVWRVMGFLPDDADQHPAADGAPKTAEASARRLARMVGADLDEAPPAAWTALARVFAREQEALLLRAVERQLSRGLLLSDDAPLVGVGCGSFIVCRLADRLGRPYRDFADLIDAATPEAAAEASRCAPAVAVALLALEDDERRG